MNLIIAIDDVTQAADRLEVYAKVLRHHKPKPETVLRDENNNAIGFARLDGPDPEVMRQTIADLIEWDALMGFNEADVWRRARKVLGHDVDEDGEDQCHDDDAPYCDRCGYQHPNDCFESDVPQDTLDAEAEESEEAAATPTITL